MNGYYSNNNIGSPLYTASGIMTPNQDSVNPNNLNPLSTQALNQAMNSEAGRPYIEGVLYRTAPIRARLYTTFPDSTEYRDKVFDGVIEASGRDHIVMSLQNSQNWVLVPIIYMDYIEFLEGIDQYLRK